MFWVTFSHHDLVRTRRFCIHLLDMLSQVTLLVFLTKDYNHSLRKGLNIDFHSGLTLLNLQGISFSYYTSFQTKRVHSKWVRLYIVRLLKPLFKIDRGHTNIWLKWLGLPTPKPRDVFFRKTWYKCGTCRYILNEWDESNEFSTPICDKAFLRTVQSLHEKLNFQRIACRRDNSLTWRKTRYEFKCCYS